MDEKKYTEWLCVDVSGYKIICVYKPLRSRFTPTAIPTFPHSSLYVGDFNCQHGITTKHILTVRTRTPEQHPTTLNCCMTQMTQRKSKYLGACIPRRHRKKRVPCWDKDCETLYRSFNRSSVGTDSDKAALSTISTTTQDAGAMARSCSFHRLFALQPQGVENHQQT